MNHRAYYGLPTLSSRVVYHDLMALAKVEADAWPALADAWHTWLLKHCPTLYQGNQRILIELQGALCEKLGLPRTTWRTSRTELWPDITASRWLSSSPAKLLPGLKTRVVAARLLGVVVVAWTGEHWEGAKRAVYGVLYGVVYDFDRLLSGNGS